MTCHSKNLMVPVPVGTKRDNVYLQWHDLTLAEFDVARGSTPGHWFPPTSDRAGFWSATVTIDGYTVRLFTSIKTEHSVEVVVSR